MPAVEVLPTASEPLRRQLTTAGVGLTGATVRCDCRRSADGLYLDFADNTFKAVGVVGTRYRALPPVDAVEAPGLYEGTALDLGAIVGGVAAGDVLTVTYYTTAPSALTLDQDELRVVAAGATAANVSDGTAAVLAKLPAALVGGRIDASVGAMAADVLTSSALAASAVTEIQSGLAVPGSAMTLAADAITAATIAAGAIGASEAPLLANLDAAVSSRAASGSAMTLADDAITAAKIAAGAIGATEAPLLATISTATEKTNDALYNARRIAANGAITQMADDGVTPAYTATGTDVNGNAVTIQPGTVARTTALTAV